MYIERKKLNNSEKIKLEIIKKVKESILTRKEAKAELSLSLKQIDRLRAVLDNEGEKGFIHKNRGKPSKNKISQTIIEELKILYNAEYYDYNMTAFYEEITENKKYKGKYDISYSTLYNAFLNDDIISPIAHKRTIKLYNDKLLLTMHLLENLAICTGSVKKSKWMPVKRDGLAILFHIFI